ncbi:MAG: glycosyltransferase family protein [Chthoniobacteraceae bacterium]
MQVVAIIQARLGSTRLPRKVLAEILGRPMLAVLLDRLRGAQSVDEFVIATTDQPHDAAVAELAAAEGVACYRGSEDDVLDRFYQTAKLHHADIIVRLTGDNPLMDADLVDWIVGEFRKQPIDYAAISHELGFPPGIGGEIFTMSALEQAWKEAAEPERREHVTSFIYQQPERFRCAKLGCETDYSHVRGTVDTPADLEVVCHIFNTVGSVRFPWRDFPALLERHPEWRVLNATAS